VQNTGTQAVTVNTSPVRHTGALVPQTPSVISPVQNTGVAPTASQDQHIFYQQNVVTPTGQVLYQMTFPANSLPADNQQAPAEPAPPTASYNHPTNKRITSAGTFVPTFTAVS
jgi:hypothetical protein